MKKLIEEVLLIRDIESQLKSSRSRNIHFEKIKILNAKNNTDSVFSLIVAGVGPGDPLMLTLAAITAIREATLIAFPVSVEGGISIASQIASDWMSPDQKRLGLVFPMIKDPMALKKSWSKATEQLINLVRNGEKVVYLSQGDSSLFSTASYLLIELQKKYPEFLVKVIPGITSFSAAAASSHFPLALMKEQLLVVPSPDEPEALRDVLVEAAGLDRIIALLKIGDKWQWIRPLLEKMNLLRGSVFAQKLGFEDQEIKFASEVSAGVKPYFSLLLIRQTWPSTLVD